MLWKLLLRVRVQGAPRRVDTNPWRGTEGKEWPKPTGVSKSNPPTSRSSRERVMLNLLDLPKDLRAEVRCDVWVRATPRPNFEP